MGIQTYEELGSVPSKCKRTGVAREPTALQAKYDAVVEELAETKEALGEMTDLAQSAKAFEDKAEFKEMQVLRLELKSCKRRRDELMAENAAMKKHIAYLQRKSTMRSGSPNVTRQSP